jgi:NADH/NAD ratio-sensing transcriptional regulator Rex
MTLRPYKFQISAVLQDVDADGEAVGERATNPVEVFGMKALKKWVSTFEKNVAALEKP